MEHRGFVLTLLISLSSASVSATLFPNITAIPPWQQHPNATTSAAWDAFTKLAGCHSGETRDGLSKLKRYFSNFGYIPNSPSSNFTDDFDDELEKALKTYQQNFNLDVNSQLDDRTLEHIVRPRCGNADVVNGTSSMNSGNSSSFETVGHFHTTGHYTFFPGMPREGRLQQRFPEMVRRYDADFHGNGFVLHRRYHDRFLQRRPRRRRTVRWDFRDVGSRVFSSEWEVPFGCGRELGRFRRRHEVGDAFGCGFGDDGRSRDRAFVRLGHSSVENAIMYPTITSGTRKVELGDDDIQGIQSLYGTNPNYNGSTTPTATREDRESSGGEIPYLASRWTLAGFLAIVVQILLV
ncbi:putative Transducin/WD40 repeat-like superfamily protein [Hibiscus syriacus]|uniref:Transducin/WD40 repeat-like superfamily protein n=1 Tax=Hibiscus syriacus TaxID=106335 RepID=A0A6A2XIJ5_HIBSY|nr:putative Transducin/WD40 repeat-like superfamily protein [Hibiscus syriacus]